jgi:uncharacterized Zn finger protein
MKLNVSCQKCSSTDVSIVAGEKDPTPMYKCNNCGFTRTLFPQIKDKKDEYKEQP